MKLRKCLSFFSVIFLFLINVSCSLNLTPQDFAKERLESFTGDQLTYTKCNEEQYTIRYYYYDSKKLGKEICIKIEDDTKFMQPKTDYYTDYFLIQYENEILSNYRDFLNNEGLVENQDYKIFLRFGDNWCPLYEEITDFNSFLSCYCSKYSDAYISINVFALYQNGQNIVSIRDDMEAKFRNYLSKNCPFNVFIEFRYFTEFPAVDYEYSLYNFYIHASKTA